MNAVVDANVLIDIVRGDARAEAALIEAARSGAVYASEIARFEVLVGMRPAERARTETLFGALTWVPVGERQARKAAEFRAAWAQSHGGIDDADYLIAATAEILEATVLTRNVEHFPMFPGLESAY